MNGSLKAVAGVAAISIGLGISIGETQTNADLNVNEWQITGNNNISTVVSGVTTLENCPLELTPCDVKYNGDVSVNINLVDNKLQLSPTFSLSEISYVEVPVIDKTERENNSEIISEV